MHLTCKVFIYRLWLIQGGFAMNFKDAVKNRRSIYNINNLLPVSVGEVEVIIKDMLLNVPSAFNSQSARVVLLTDGKHELLWNMIKEALYEVVPESGREALDAKLSGFSSGKGTILYFEDMKVVEDLQKGFPLYASEFMIWSNQSNGMLQFAIWSALEEVGIGANLQHYSNLIQDRVLKEFDLPKTWKLLAQMPIGGIVSMPDEKEFDSLDYRYKYFQ